MAIKDKEIEHGKIPTVDPGSITLSLKDGNQVRWRAINSEVTIWCPNSMPFGWEHKQIAQGSSDVSGPLSASCRSGDEFEYAVYTHKGNSQKKRKLAVGASNPKVGVDP